MDTLYHAGEVIVQRRAGVEEMARKVARSIHDTLPAIAQGFLRSQSVVFVTTVDAAERPWVSLLTGSPGFLSPLDERTVRVEATPTAGDPLAGNLTEGSRVGMLAIDFARRQRMRINGGIAALNAGSFVVRASEVYGNCPKYIQQRSLWVSHTAAEVGSAVRSGEVFQEEHRHFIETADTFVLGSVHPRVGADASHRGGAPGFISVLDEGTLGWSDYPGNGMFNSLGNLVEHPKAGLLFLDFDRGATLQLTGTAVIGWDSGCGHSQSGTRREVTFATSAWVETQNATTLRWKLVEYSPYNPPTK